MKIFVISLWTKNLKHTCSFVALMARSNIPKVWKFVYREIYFKFNRELKPVKHFHLPIKILNKQTNKQIKKKSTPLWMLVIVITWKRIVQRKFPSDRSWNLTASQLFLFREVLVVVIVNHGSILPSYGEWAALPKYWMRLGRKWPIKIKPWQCLSEEGKQTDESDNGEHIVWEAPSLFYFLEKKKQAR